MRRAVTSPKRGLLFSIAVFTALALVAPSGALAETGLDISSIVSEPGGVLVAQMRGRTTEGPPRGLTGSEGESVRVPDVKGKPQAEAERLLEGKGLRHQVGMRVPTTDRNQVGKVASQFPEAGKTVLKGTKVVLSVLRYMALPGGGGRPPPGWHPPGLGGGSRTRKVNTPSVIGMPQAAAEKLLNNVGLKSRVGKVTLTPDKRFDGRVVSQSPYPGTPVSLGTTVTLDFHKLIESVKVPDVVGKTEKEAVWIIQSAGLNTGDYRQNRVGTEDSNKFGKVKAQRPAAGQDVPVYTYVTLDVYFDDSRGPVPGVIGMTKAEAERKLRDARFGSRVRGLVVTGDRPKDGLVAAQAPPPGTRVARRGTTVALDVYKFDPQGPKSVTIVGTPTTTTTTTGPGKPIVIIDQRYLNKIVGWRLQNAITWLGKDGYTVNVRRWWPVGEDYSKSNRVTKAYWPRGNRIDVDVYLYEISKKYKVPDVRGFNIDKAAKLLSEVKGANFKAKARGVDTSNPTKTCEVASQDPAGGTETSKGREILLGVYQYKGGIFGGGAQISSCQGLFSLDRH